MLGDFNLNGIAPGTSSEMVGLGNVNNTSDAAKPISGATQTSLNTIISNYTNATPLITTLNSVVASNYTTVSKNLDLTAPLSSPAFTGTVTGITSGLVGLGDCDNTSEINKPISTATQTSLSTLDGTVTTLNTNFTSFKTNLDTSLTLSGPTTINTDAYVNGNLYSTLDTYLYGKIGQGTTSPESA